MPRLEDLRKNLLTMTPDELRTRIREIRGERRLSKESPKARSTRVKGTAKAKTNITELLAGMSSEEREALIASLEG